MRYEIQMPVVWMPVQTDLKSEYGNPEEALMEKYDEADWLFSEEEEEVAKVLLGLLSDEDRLIMSCEKNLSQREIGVLIGRTQPSVSCKIKRIKAWVLFVYPFKRGLIEQGNPLLPDWDPKGLKAHFWNLVVNQHASHLGASKEGDYTTTLERIRTTAFNDMIERGNPAQAAVAKLLKSDKRRFWTRPFLFGQVRGSIPDLKS